MNTAVLMLEDTAKILSRSNNFNLSEIYQEGNIKIASSLWQQLKYHQKLKITEDLEVSFLNAGHILGSAMVEFIYRGKKILFTGDLGKSQSLLLPDSEELTDINYLFMESVYGDRNHELVNDRREILKRTVEDNYKRKGTLIIPTFSLERAQELLFEFNYLVENKLIPIMPIFLDSPLAIHLTEIFKRYESYFNQRTQEILSKDEYLFDFPGLHSILKSKESKMILEVLPPKIIIAGSGMSLGGRIIHHEKNYLSDPNNTILLVGYQSTGTPGRLIQEGVKSIWINGEEIAVRAKVITIYGYSGHKDSDELLNFVETTQETLEKVFVLMGEPKAQNFLAQKIKENLGVETKVPEFGESVLLSC
jgi:metallo-beta-lactamase family protein